MSDETCWVGIDVCKANLDVFISVGEHSVQVAHPNPLP